MYSGHITDVEGIELGHATHRQGATGVTAILARQGAVAGVDVRGGGPGTRETDALMPGRLVEKAHAILLCGGSAYGLDAAAGAMAYLERQQIGYPTVHGPVPIVSAAVIYDLGCGQKGVRPNSDMGALALLSADTSPFAQGRVGGGAGATVGKLLPGCTPSFGGVGTASIALPGGVVVGAVVVVNAAGDVRDPHTGRWLACGRDEEGRLCPASQRLFELNEAPSEGPNTTIGVVATNAALTVSQAQRMSMVAHDGLARTIVPAHLPVDGDTVYALSTAGKFCDINLLCAAGAEAMARAVANAALAAQGENP